MFGGGIEEPSAFAEGTAESTGCCRTLNRTLFGALFGQSQPHRDSHPEILRSLNAATVDVEQIAIVNGLQSRILEQPVSLRLETAAIRVRLNLRSSGVSRSATIPSMM